MEKNLLNPRACFSGVRVKAVEDPDFVERCVGYCELTGDLRMLFASESDGQNEAFNKVEGDSEPALCKSKELAVSISKSSLSCIFCMLPPLMVGSSSMELSVVRDLSLFWEF